MLKKTIGRAALLGCSAALLVSCTSQAGPYITNISNTGPNKVLIEKCTAQFNALLFSVHNGDCTTHELTLQAPPNGK